jgi:hypothetical protein
MAYSKAYQTLEAGRTREDEAISFFKNNKVALPARVTSFNSMGGASSSPAIVADYLQNSNAGKIPATMAHVGVAKTAITTDNLSTGTPPRVQIS